MSFKYSIPTRKNKDAVYSQGELYKEYYPIIMKLLIGKKRSIMDAEDIAHNVFVYLFERWGDIKWETIENLLSIILYQRVVKYYRQFIEDDNVTGGSELIELLDSELVRDPLEYVVLIDFRKTLQGAFTTLSKTEKDIFYGFYIEGRGIEEMRGNRHRGSMHNLLFRARNKVSEYFSKYYSKRD